MVDPEKFSAAQQLLNLPRLQTDRPKQGQGHRSAIRGSGFNKPAPELTSYKHQSELSSRSVAGAAPRPLLRSSLKRLVDETPSAYLKLRFSARDRRNTAFHVFTDYDLEVISKNYRKLTDFLNRIYESPSRFDAEHLELQRSAIRLQMQMNQKSGQRQSVANEEVADEREFVFIVDPKTGRITSINNLPNSPQNSRASHLSRLKNAFYLRFAKRRDGTTEVSLAAPRAWLRDRDLRYVGIRRIMRLIQASVRAALNFELPS